MKNYITYEKLFDVLRKEKTNSQLETLDSNFFSDVLDYMKEKNAILESNKVSGGLFSGSEVVNTQKQLDNFKRLLAELYDRRLSKIIQLAVFSSRSGKMIEEVSLMLEEEKEFYNYLYTFFRKQRENVLVQLLNSNIPKKLKDDKPKELKREDTEKNKLIRFLHPIPKFVGDDLNIYGPYEKEDVASLPTNIANLLIKRKRAKEMRTD